MLQHFLIWPACATLSKALALMCMDHLDAQHCWLCLSDTHVHVPTALPQRRCPACCATCRQVRAASAVLPFSHNYRHSVLEVCRSRTHVSEHTLGFPPLPGPALSILPEMDTLRRLAGRLGGSGGKDEAPRAKKEEAMVAAPSAGASDSPKAGLTVSTQVIMRGHESGKDAGMHSCFHRCRQAPQAHAASAAVLPTALSPTLPSCRAPLPRAPRTCRALPSQAARCHRGRRRSGTGNPAAGRLCQTGFRQLPPQRCMPARQSCIPLHCFPHCTPVTPPAGSRQ